MDQKMVIGVVALIVVIAGGWYLLAKAPVQNGSQQAAVANAGNTGTFGDLLAMGPSECNVTVEQGGVQSQGTVHVAGGKMSGDFTTTVNGQSAHAYIINDGANLYSWSDQGTQGLKLPLPPATATSTASSAENGFNGTPAQFSCAPWAEDDSVFTPPSTISFLNPTTQTPKAPTGAPR